MNNLVLDISKWDTDIDLAAWKNKHNLWGVIIKAGGNEGSRYKDSYFDRHYKAAKAAGLHIGAYYYTVITSVSGAAEDARHFAGLLNGYDLDMPCYMDVEDSRQFALSARALTDVIKSFCDTLKSLGRYPGLYTGGSAWINNMYKDELTQYANWIASWQKNWPTYVGDIGMWQQGGIRYSDGNIVYDDVAGYHDCDWCCVDYPSIIKGNQPDSQPQPTPQPSKNGTAKDVIDIALGEVGYYAPDDPERGSKYGRWSAERTGEDWMAGPSTEIWWCCMFVSWCLDQGHVTMDGFPSQNTDVALGNGATKYIVDKYSVKYGDIVIFNWNWDNATDHIGFATSSSDGYGFSTVEGNCGNAVKKLYRNFGNVAYVLRPPYEGETAPVEPDNAHPKNNRDGDSLEVDGIGGWNTIIDWQHQLNADEDGWIRGQYIHNSKYFKGISNVSWEDNGSVFVQIIQKKVGVEADGYWGINTSKAIQQWLIDKGFSVGPDGADGYFGPNSTKALQESLNAKAWTD